MKFNKQQKEKFNKWVGEVLGTVLFETDFLDIEKILTDNESIPIEPPVMLKLAEKRIDKLYKSRVQYVKDDCDDIADSIDDEINLLKGLVNGLKYYMGNISKFSE